MNNDPRTETDELISAYLDGALTERQQTELKRLVQHQPEIGDQIGRLRRQRELLCSLPVETAPPSMVHDVQARLERTYMLDKMPPSRSWLSVLSLARRRLTAAAAMLLLPAALLGFVLWRIVTPVGDTVAPPTAQIPHDDPTTSAVADVGAQMPFDGVLVLTVQRPVLTAQAIEKQIFLHSLEHQTLMDRTADRVTFQIDCPAEALAELMESLKPLWPRIAESRLTVRDSDTARPPLTVAHIRPEQIQALALHTDTDALQDAARQYAAANTPLRPRPEQPDTASEEDILSPDQLPIPQPLLAWPDRQEVAEPPAGPDVSLLIEVRRSDPD